MTVPGEVPLTGGWVTEGVVRVGSTARRPLRARSDFVQRVLLELEAVGFEEAPRYLGLDEHGRQILTFFEGTVPSDCRAIVWSDEELSAAAQLLRRYHDAIAGSHLTSGDEVVCHNDFGPWNLVWSGGSPVAIIDFDEAAPGARFDDLGYGAWKHLNLGLVPLEVDEQRRRLGIFAAAYGVDVDESLVAAIDGAQARMEERIGGSGPSPALDPAPAQLQAERAWLATHARTRILRRGGASKRKVMESQ